MHRCMRCESDFGYSLCAVGCDPEMVLSAAVSTTDEFLSVDCGGQLTVVCKA